MFSFKGFHEHAYESVHHSPEFKVSRVRYCWSSVVSRVPSQDNLAKSVPWVSWASECGESGPSSSTSGAIVDKREDKRRRVAASVATSSGSRGSQVSSEAMTYLKTAHERCSQALAGCKKVSRDLRQAISPIIVVPCNTFESSTLPLFG